MCCRRVPENVDRKHMGMGTPQQFEGKNDLRKSHRFSWAISIMRLCAFSNNRYFGSIDILPLLYFTRKFVVRSFLTLVKFLF